MSLVDYILQVAIMLFFVSLFGYFFAVLKEKICLINNKIIIKSNEVTQELLDDLDLKIFKLGNIKLSIGDEIKIYLNNNNSIKGIVLGAKKVKNCLYILTVEDRIIELNIKNIKKLRILSRYGKIF